MVSETEIHSLVTQSKGTGKSFAEFLADLFRDKFVEIYVGDSYEDVSTEQVSTTYPAVFCGKVVAAYRECLILNCAHIAAHNKIELGNYMFISERAIRALTEIDNNGTIEDMMLRSKESVAIKLAFTEGIKKR